MGNYTRKVERFEEMVEILKVLEQREEDSMYSREVIHCEYDAQRDIECRRQKYHKRVQSRKRKIERMQKKKDFRKWNGKDDEKRITRKMKKYESLMGYI